MNPTILSVIKRIMDRSKDNLDRMQKAAKVGPRRQHLSCGNQAHAYAAIVKDRNAPALGEAANLGIITAYNDMLSAHQPFERFPNIIRAAARKAGCTAQVAGGVPAMCDGVTQGQAGMELSLFSRDVIALAAGISLSHNTFDAVVYLGVCDKIVPGLMIAAATFGYLPGIFLPAGPMTSGLPNDEKAAVRQKFAIGEVDRAVLMKAEMASYHEPGTCTFYGTANSNQMLMEFMGLHLPGSSFVNPGTELREELTKWGTQRSLQITALGNEFTPLSVILDERAFVNGIVGLMATGGSTNLVLHLPAMARAAGIILCIEDFDEISSVIPLMAKVYPNGLADVNHFHAAGGLGFMIRQLLDKGFLHENVKTVVGDGLRLYTKEPKLTDKGLKFVTTANKSQNEKILRSASKPFQKTGGLKKLEGSLGIGVIKVSSVKPEHLIVEAPVRIFHSQEAVKYAFSNKEFTSNTIIVVRFQGPRANGMPELHGLTPILASLQDRGLKVALLTDGRMSGASGKVPSAIHMGPEAAIGGPIAKLLDGDIICLNAIEGTLNVLCDNFGDREAIQPDLSEKGYGVGRELFSMFRKHVGKSSSGSSIFG